MISAIIRVGEKYAKSDFISIQQEHIKLYLEGSLYSVCLFTKENEFLKEYKDRDLQELLGSALANGRRTAVNHFTGAQEFYYLGKR
jgi:hypothetical protein